MNMNERNCEDLLNVFAHCMFRNEIESHKNTTCDISDVIETGDRQCFLVRSTN